MMIPYCKHLRLLLLLIISSCIYSITYAQDLITIEFDTDSTSFGTLNLAEYGALDETPAPDIASFTISDITGPDLAVSLSALSDDINLLVNGLADGSTGFDNAGEGFTLSFNRAITLVSLDWSSFDDSDQGTLLFSTGIDPILVSESDASWESTTSDIQSIGLSLSPSELVTFNYTQGSYLLQGLTLETQTVVPEPSFYGCTAGFMALFIALIIRRKKCRG